MRTFDIDARMITYITLAVEADTPEEALAKAKQLISEGMFLEGDTELDRDSLEIVGEYL